MKYRKLLIGLVLWEGFVWFGYNGHLFRPQIWVLFDEKTIYEGHYLGGAYFNTGNYMLVLAITSVIAIEYCTKGEGVQMLVRHRSRSDFVCKRLQTLVIVSIMYTIIHFAMGYALSLHIFQAEYVLNERTGLFYAVSAPTLLLFFLRVNIVYILLRDFINRRILAIAGILGISLLELFVGYYVFDDNWFPCKDLDIGALAYLGRLGDIGFALVIIRQVGLTVIAAIISHKWFEHKDVMQIEN